MIVGICHVELAIASAETTRLVKPSLIERTVPVAIDAAERLAIEVPFVRFDSPIAVVIEVVEAGLCPAVVPLVPVRHVIGLFPVCIALRAGPDPLAMADRAGLLQDARRPCARVQDRGRRANAPAAHGRGR